MGLRFCGMVEDEPRPGTNGSNASPTSVCIISITSVAILASVPVTSASSDTASAMPSRATCQGVGGRPSPSSAISASCTARPLSPSEASVPAAPANWPTSTRGRSSSSRWRCRTHHAAPHRRLVAERHRQGVLQVRAPGHHRVAVLAGQRRQRRVERRQVRLDQRQRVPICSTVAVSMMSCVVAPQCT